MSHDFKLMGQGFDTVQVSFQTRIPDALVEPIRETQRAAKEHRQPEPVSLGPGKVAGEVLRHGGGGGDAIFSTGDLGEMYFFKLDQKGDKWGVTVKIRAMALLCYGLPGALDRMWTRAQGLSLEVSGYSLGRYDYRFDVLTDAEFALQEECLVRHNRALVRPFEAVDRKHPAFEWNDDPDTRRILRGMRIQTLMVGKLGSSIQLVIYDKRSEITATRNYSLLESYNLDLRDKSWRLWRVEVRFAGDALKRRWNVRDFPTLKTKLHPMLDKALANVRYVAPGQEHLDNDERTAHPLWDTATNAIAAATSEQPSQFAPERAEHLIREERMRSLQANIAGCALSGAAMQSNDPAQVQLLAPQFGYSAVERALAIDPGKSERAVRREWKYAKVANRE